MSQFIPNPAISGLIDQATEALIQAVANDLHGNISVAYSLQSHAPYTETPSVAPEPPAMITGLLEGGTSQRPIPGGIEVFNDVVYAHIHEFGGVITPKNAKALTVPIGGNGRRFLEIAKTAGWQWAMHAYGAWISKKTGDSQTMGIVMNKDLGPLVALRMWVNMPARPVWQPAMAKTVQDFPVLAQTVWRRFFP